MVKTLYVLLLTINTPDGVSIGHQPFDTVEECKVAMVAVAETPPPLPWIAACIEVSVPGLGDPV